MPTWHLARGGIQKSIARVQAHFSSPHSSRRFSVLCPVPKRVSLFAGYLRARITYHQESAGKIPTARGMGSSFTFSQASLILFQEKKSISS